MKKQSCEYSKSENNFTGRMKNCNGIPVFVPNDTFDLTDLGCYVSYNNRDIGIYGCDVTALIRMDGINPTKFLILNGNHVNEYLKLKKYDSCVEYFKSNLDKQNILSENWDEEIITNEDGSIYIKKVENHEF